MTPEYEKVVILNDGETFSSATGCKILEIPTTFNKESDILDIDDYVKEHFDEGEDVIKEGNFTPEDAIKNGSEYYEDEDGIMQRVEDRIPVLSIEDIEEWVHETTGDAESFNATVLGAIANICNGTESPENLQQSILKVLAGS